MLVLYILIGLATVAYFLYLHFTRTFNYWRDRNVAGPVPVPFFGNIMECALRRKVASFVLKQIYDDFANEKVVGVYQMTSPCLLIRDPDILKQLMIKDFYIFADRGVHFSNDVMGDNLFHADTKTWQILRNKFTPLFTSAKLKNMFHLLNETSDKFISFVEKKSETQPEQEVYQLMGKYTTMAIATCAFGLDLDFSENNDVMNALQKINKKLFTLSYAVELDMLYPGILTRLGVAVFPKIVTNFFKDLVTQVLVARKGSPTSRNDFMDLLLEMKQSNTVQGSRRLEGEDADTLKVTEDLMAAQAFVFYSGGYDTSATIMAYMLYHLALNPEIQERVVTEIEEVLERHGGEITYDVLQDLTYFDRVFHETLRIHPLGGFLRRTAAVDYEIPGTNVTLKKGQTIIVSAFSLHHDEKYWPNPSIFNPDRFSPENVAKRHPAVYLPFGIGPRNCIGIRFAKTQIRVVMVKLLRRFKVEATENTCKEFCYNPYRYFTFPIGGIKMNLLPRQNQETY